MWRRGDGWGSQDRRGALTRLLVCSTVFIFLGTLLALCVGTAGSGVVSGPTSVLIPILNINPDSLPSVIRPVLHSSGEQWVVGSGTGAPLLLSRTGTFLQGLRLQLRWDESVNNVVLDRTLYVQPVRCF